MPRLQVVPLWTLVSVEGKCKGPRFSGGLLVEFVAVEKQAQRARVPD